MKKFFIVFSVSCFTSFLSAQNVGISTGVTPPDASAMLDIVSTTQGLLVPRVSLTAINVAAPVTLPATSLLVYNINTAGIAPNNVIPGFYYWDGAKWVAFGGSGGKDWSLLGNSGTTPATNFLGTTDAQAFILRTNNTERMRFLSTGNIGIGTTTPAYNLEMRLAAAGTYVASFENISSTGAALQAYNTVGTLNALGGVSNFIGGTGSYGVQLQATGAGAGVYGTSNSSASIGVRGSIPTTGAWTGYGGYFTGGLGYVNGLYNLSDRKVKSNIVVIDHAIEKILNIEGVSYNYNSNDYPYIANGDTRTYLGFIAQDIKKVLPEAVAEKSLPVTGDKKSTASVDLRNAQYETFNVVDYTAIVPVLVEAVKEQQKQIEELKKEVQKLKEK